MTDLLPCPFCGGLKISAGYNEHGGFVSLCDNCDASGPPASEMSTPAIISAWNARTPVSVQEAAKVLLESLGDYDNNRSHPAFEAASQAYDASNKPAPFNVIGDALIGALRAISKGSTK